MFLHLVQALVFPISLNAFLSSCSHIIMLVMSLQVVTVFMSHYSHFYAQLVSKFKNWTAMLSFILLLILFYINKKVTCTQTLKLVKWRQSLRWKYNHFVIDLSFFKTCFVLEVWSCSCFPFSGSVFGIIFINNQHLSLYQSYYW